MANYRSSEGKTVMIPYKGPVAATVLDLLGGIRSTCTYVGARSLEEAHPRTTFIRVTQQINNIFGTSDLRSGSLGNLIGKKLQPTFDQAQERCYSLGPILEPF